MEWNEPDKKIVSDAVLRLKSEYEDSLPAKKKEYLAASLPRFRFVAAEAVKRFVPNGKILDLGCAPDTFPLSCITLASSRTVWI